MKTWIVILLIIIGLYLVGCSRDEEVTSLSEYEMVYEDTKQRHAQQTCVSIINDCQIWG